MDILLEIPRLLVRNLFNISKYDAECEITYSFWETDVLWFLTVQNLFYPKGIFNENQVYEFLLMALDLRHF